MVEFESWLTEKLTALGTDASVFSPYIVGILESEETPEEQEEGIDSILSDIITDESLIEALKKEIKTNWTKFNNNLQEEESKKPDKPVEDLCVQMHRIMEEKNSTFSSNKREQTDEEKKLKAAILASYGEVEEDGDESDDNGNDEDIAVANNAADVAKAQLEWREGQKQAAMAKREKDKSDRDTQKKTAEDRKKKAQAKTAKVERRA